MSYVYCVNIKTFRHPSCILLKCKAEDADLLVGDGVEQALHDLPRKPGALEGVEGHHLVPVLGNLWQVQAFTEANDQIYMLLNDNIFTIMPLSFVAHPLYFSNVSLSLSICI